MSQDIPGKKPGHGILAAPIIAGLIFIGMAAYAFKIGLPTGTELYFFGMVGLGFLLCVAAFIFFSYLLKKEAASPTQEEPKEPKELTMRQYLTAVAASLPISLALIFGIKAQAEFTTKAINGDIVAEALASDEAMDSARAFTADFEIFSRSEVNRAVFVDTDGLGTSKIALICVEDVGGEMSTWAMAPFRQTPGGMKLEKLELPEKRSGLIADFCAKSFARIHSEDTAG